MFKKFFSAKTTKVLGVTSTLLATSYLLNKKVKNLEIPKVSKEIIEYEENLSSSLEFVLYGAMGVGSLIVGSGLIYMSRYIRCPPNKILVIYGGKQKARTIHGGGSFVFPILQDYRFLSLNPLQIEINLKNTLSLQKIRVNVPSVFTVAVGTSPELMNNAAERMLELSIDEIKYQAEEIIYGQLRDVIASMTIEEINSDRALFAKKVEEVVELELHKLGLVLINVNFTDVTDQSGAIEALGKKAAAEALQNARVDVSEKEKLGAIGESNAIRERDIVVSQQKSDRAKGVHLAQVDEQTTIKKQERDMYIEFEKANSEKEIGINKARTEKEKQIRMQERDLQIVTATTKSQQEVGVSQAKLEQQKLIALQEKETRIAVSLANAEAVKGENDAKMQIEKVNALLNITKAEAFEDSEKRKKQAEANVLETEYLFNEKVAKAKEQQIKAENLAQLVGPAEAQRVKEIIEAETIAQKKIIEAEALAKSILKEAEAKAKGEYLFLEARALGLGKLIEQCGSSKNAVQLLMLDHIEELAKISATAISNIKFDQITVWEGGNQKDGNATSNFIKNIATSLPPLHTVMKNVAGVDMEKFLGGVIDVPKIERKEHVKEEPKVEEKKEEKVEEK